MEPLALNLMLQQACAPRQDISVEEQEEWVGHLLMEATLLGIRVDYQTYIRLAMFYKELVPKAKVPNMKDHLRQQ